MKIKGQTKCQRPAVVKEKRFKQIQEFIDGRAVKNKEYFDKNECIKTAYTFVKKVVDYIN